MGDIISIFQRLLEDDYGHDYLVTYQGGTKTICCEAYGIIASLNSGMFIVSYDGLEIQKVCQVDSMSTSDMLKLATSVIEDRIETLDNLN